MPTLALSLFFALIISFWMKTGLVGAANQITLAEATRKCRDHPDYGNRYIAQNTENKNWTCVLDPYQEPRFNIKSGCPSNSVEPDPDCPPVYPNPTIPAPICPTPICPTPIIPTPVCPTPIIPTPICPAPVIPTPVCPTPVCPNPDGSGSSNAKSCPALDRQTISMMDGARYTFFCGTLFWTRRVNSRQFEAASIFECVERAYRGGFDEHDYLSWRYNRLTRMCTPALEFAQTVRGWQSPDYDSATRASPRCGELHGRNITLYGRSYIVSCGFTVPSGNNRITTFYAPSFLNCMCCLSEQLTIPTQCHTDNKFFLVRSYALWGNEPMSRSQLQRGYKSLMRIAGCVRSH